MNILVPEIGALQTAFKSEIAIFLKKTATILITFQ
jgi:hypothetical protein